MHLQSFFAETSANFADGLEFFRLGVVAGEEECPIDVCALSLTIVTTHDNQIKGVTNARKIVFLEL